MITLYIRLPSHAAIESLEGARLYCAFALTTNNGAIDREGVAPLSEMGAMITRAQRTVLLVAASDVTLLRVKVPPLSAARLKAALPNLVEDALMSDPAECVVVADQTRADTRTVAVVQRQWLELVSRSIFGLGARNVGAVPAQLCLPHQADTVSATVVEQGSDVSVAVRLGEHEGIGLSLMAEQQESVAFEVLQTLAAVVPQAPITLAVPQGRVRDYQDSLNIAPTLADRITVQSDDWRRWIANADKAGIDLMSGLGADAGPKIDWRPWRWPAVLAACLLLVNVIALNVDWLRMKRESDALRTGMVQSYKSAFPKESVIIDPLAQLRQKIASGQHGAGQAAPDDFLTLAAGFADAWNSTGLGKLPVASLEYRDRTLNIKLKPDTSVSMGPLKSALSARNLALTQPNAGMWQIRSGK